SGRNVGSSRQTRISRCRQDRERSNRKRRSIGCEDRRKAGLHRRSKNSHGESADAVAGRVWRGAGISEQLKVGSLNTEDTEGKIQLERCTFSRVVGLRKQQQLLRDLRVLRVQAALLASFSYPHID